MTRRDYFLKLEEKLKKTNKTRMFMKKLVNYLPFILLVSLIGLSFYAGSTVALSVAIFALSGLSGYRYYLDEQVKPDLEAIFAKKLEDIEAKNKEDLSWVKAELANVKKNMEKYLWKSRLIRKFKWRSGNG